MKSPFARALRPFLPPRKWFTSWCANTRIFRHARYFYGMIGGEFWGEKTGKLGNLEMGILRPCVGVHFCEMKGHFYISNKSFKLWWGNCTLLKWWEKWKFIELERKLSISNLMKIFLYLNNHWAFLFFHSKVNISV